MQEPYWAVFNEGRLTYLGLSQGEALEFLRINGGSSVEQIRSLDQLAEALHRHKADHEEKRTRLPSFQDPPRTTSPKTPAAHFGFRDPADRWRTRPLHAPARTDRSRHAPF